MDLKAIGRRIKIAREQKGLTQEALAELVDLTPMHISVIERGFKPTKLETFCRIANVLGVSADTLLPTRFFTRHFRMPTTPRTGLHVTTVAHVIPTRKSAIG